MGTNKGKSPEASPPQTPSATRQSGRVAFDSRGNPTWEWQTATGVFGRDVSTQRLKKLEAPELKLADTMSVPKPEGLSLESPARMPGGGFNPYDSSSSGPAAHTKRTTSPASPARKPVRPVPKTGMWNKLKDKIGR